jgi:hypothetical protein
VLKKRRAEPQPNPCIPLRPLRSLWLALRRASRELNTEPTI